MCRGPHRSHQPELTASPPGTHLYRSYSLPSGRRNRLHPYRFNYRDRQSFASRAYYLIGSRYPNSTLLPDFAAPFCYRDSPIVHHRYLHLPLKVSRRLREACRRHSTCRAMHSMCYSSRFLFPRDLAVANRRWRAQSRPRVSCFAYY